MERVISNVKPLEPEYSGPLTFFGIPEKLYIQNKDEARAAIGEALVKMFEYNEQRSQALQNKAALCDAQYQKAWQKPMYLYIELNDMVIMLEDYFKVFDYLGLSELLSSAGGVCAQKVIVNNEKMHGEFNINLAPKITCTNRLTGSELVPRFEMYGIKWLEFECKDFYIYGLLGSRHIVIGPKAPKDVYYSIQSMAECKTSTPIKVFYPAKNHFACDTSKPDRLYCEYPPYPEDLRKNAFFYGYAAKIAGYEGYFDGYAMMYIKGIFKNNKMSYGLTFREKGHSCFIDSNKFSRQEFLSLVKARRQEWKKVALIAGKAKEVTGLDPIDRMDNPLYTTTFNVATVQIKLPDNLLSC